MGNAVYTQKEKQRDRITYGSLLCTEYIVVVCIIVVVN